MTREEWIVVAIAGVLLIGALLFVQHRRFQIEDRIMADACRNNLRQMVAAKAGYAAAHGGKPGDVITPEQAGEHIKGGWQALRCPAHGAYSIGLVADPLDKSIPGTRDQSPSCSVHGSAEELIANQASHGTALPRRP
jgi:hypothetical protein